MMSEQELLRAAEWLSPHALSPWRWECQEDEAIVWTGESGSATIAVREELRLIVERLAPRALPPLGPILLILGACRGKVPELADLRRALAIEAGDRNDSHPIKFIERLATAEKLKVLRNVPTPLLQGVAGRVALIEYLLKNVPWCEPSRAAAVLKFFHEQIPISALPKVESGPRRTTVLSDLEIVSTSLEEFDVHAFEAFRTAGIDQVPDRAEVELPETLTGQAWLSYLEDEPELTGVVHLARDVMAAMHLPRALSKNDDQLSTGVADVGNRGPLHRLLLSELAHDDDTLAMRLALNEALFLRPAPNADPPETERIILLDSGIQSWGTPRYYALSVALGTLARLPADAKSTVYRSERGELKAVDWRNRAGLLDHLAALDPRLHAAAAIETLRSKVKGAVDDLEVIIITHPTSFANRSFETVARGLEVGELFVATVDREGQLAVYQRMPNAWRLVADARLDVEVLHRKSKPRKQPVSALPAFLSIHPAPLRLPCTVNIIRRCRLQPQAKAKAVLTENNEVWVFDQPEWGGYRVDCPRIPGSLVFFRYSNDSHLMVAAAWDSGKSRLNVLACRYTQLFDEKLTLIHVEGIPERPLTAHFRDGVLLIITENRAKAIALPSGILMGSLKFESPVRVVGERWVITTKERQLLSVVSWSGERIVQTIIRAPLANLHQLVLVFDREDILTVDGNGEMVPWIVDVHSNIRPLNGVNPTAFRAIEAPVRAAIPSDSGNRLWLRLSEGNEYVVNLETKARHRTTDYDARLSIDEVSPMSSWALRVRFTHISFDPSGVIQLKSAKGYWVKIKATPAGLQLLAPGHQKWTLPAHDGHSDGTVEFSQFFVPDASTQMMIAEWKDGSRAFLDLRGLLHLQSSDRSIPEITVALAESTSVPAWASDGSITGPKFFIGNQTASPLLAANIDRYLQQFIANIPC